MTHACANACTYAHARARERAHVGQVCTRVRWCSIAAEQLRTCGRISQAALFQILRAEGRVYLLTTSEMRSRRKDSDFEKLKGAACRAVHAPPFRLHAASGADLVVSLQALHMHQVSPRKACSLSNVQIMFRHTAHLRVLDFVRR
eukprot:6185735-Pleurochrysis_carterae.AAC.1